MPITDNILVKQSKHDFEHNRCDIFNDILYVMQPPLAGFF